MLSMLAAMAAIVFTWILAAIAFTGVGLLVSRVFRLRSNNLESIFLYFWIGWGSVVLLLQIWHLWLPVDWRATIAVSAISVPGLLLHVRYLRDLKSGVTAVTGRSRVLVLLAIGVCVTLWANIALGQPRHFDTGLYHIQAVRWNSNYPIVPGLGNLHGRLAFNCSSFLYPALLDVGPWQGRSHHVANGLLPLVLMLQMILVLPKLVRRDDPRRSYYLLLALLLVPTLDWTYKHVTSYSPDLVTFALGIVITSQLLLLLVGGLESPSRWLAIFAICLLSVVGVTVKVSFAPLGLLATLIALSIAWKDSRLAGGFGPFFRMTSVAVLIALAGFVPWMIRGVILSGYIAYPLTIGAFDVPWRLPVEKVAWMNDIIRAWARKPRTPANEVLQGWQWLGPWALRQASLVVKFVLPLICVVVGIVGLFRTRGANASPATNWFPKWWVLLPSAATLAFIFVTAPDPRFAGASVWLLGVGLIVLALDRLDLMQPNGHRRLWQVYRVTGVFLLVILARTANCWNLPNGDKALRELPQEELEIAETYTGLSVYVPDHETDQAWDAPLPSTPYPNLRLSLRRAGELASGFQLAVPSSERFPQESVSQTSNSPSGSTVEQVGRVKIDAAQRIRASRQR